MTRPVLNIADLELQPRPAANLPKGPAADKFGLRMAFIGSRIGAQKLGYNLTAVPPGKCGFPKHSHRINEEMFFVLEGTGQLTVGSATYPIRAGDVIACPPGGTDTAHQILNTGDVELKYLAVSTQHSPEICDYPDSNKFSLFAEMPPDADGNTRRFRFVSRDGQSIDYWDGE